MKVSAHSASARGAECIPMQARSNRRQGRVQRDLVRARRVRDGVLYVAPRRTAPPGTGSRERGVAVIEVSGTTLTLRAADDQEMLVLTFQTLVKAIPPGRSLQVLLHRSRRDLSDYLDQLRGVAADSSAHPMYRQLAEAHAAHVAQLGRAHALFESRFYLVFSVEDTTRDRLLERLLRRRGRTTRERAHTATRGDLDIQAERLLAHLSSMGLVAHRLCDVELVQLADRCLAPGRADHSPLAPETIASVEHPYMVKHAGESNGHLPTALPAPVERDAGNGNGNQGNTQGMSYWQYADAPADETLQPATPSMTPASSRQERRRLRGTALEGTQALPPPAWLPLSDLLAPSAVLEQPDFLYVEGEYLRGFAAVGYPREIAIGWLAPLITHDECLQISLHLHAQHPADTLRRYRRRKAELRATRRLAARKGWVDNPDESVAAGDIERLLPQVAARKESLVEVGLYLQVRAPDLATLNERSDRLLSLLKQLFLVARPATFEQLAAWQAMQPLGDDTLRRTSALDTMSLAYSFPFLTSSLAMPGGVLEGVTTSGEPVIIDDWAGELDNPHRFIGAVTGAGKSYYCKLKMLRELLVRYHEGVQIVVIDPEQEYERLCREVGGTLLRLAPGSSQHLNPFDLVPQGLDLARYLADRARGDRLAEKVQSLHALYDLMLSDRGPTGVSVLSVREKGLLDRATYEIYRQAGISADPATHLRPVPLLRDLYRVLVRGEAGKDEYGLADRLSRYVEGSLSGIFTAPTNVELTDRFVVFDMRDLSSDLRPIGTLLIADFLWTQVLASTRPRVLYIDEAWSLIQHPEGGRFLADLARRARKRYLRLVTITQSPELFVADRYGAVIAGNAATKILKKQDRTGAPAVAQRFGLSAAERQQVLALGKAEALLMTGGTRLVVVVEANALEHRLATTNPRELLAYAQAQAASDAAARETRASASSSEQRDEMRALPEPESALAPTPTPASFPPFSPWSPACAPAASVPQLHGTVGDTGTTAFPDPDFDPGFDPDFDPDKTGPQPVVRLRRASRTPGEEQALRRQTQEHERA